MFAMQVTYVLYVLYCVVHQCISVTAVSWGYCNIQGEDNSWTYCRLRMLNRTFDHIPIIPEPVTHIIFDDQPLKQLSREAFRNVTSQKQLTHVDLGNCQISLVDVDAFLHLRNLEHLSLNRNSIAHFESGTFQHTKRLKYLSVANNVIKNIQPDLLADLVHLRSVSFYKNTITHIAKGAFNNTPSLTYMNLAENKLNYLDPLFKDSFVNVTDLHLDGNPWDCDCKLRELFEIYNVRRPADEHAGPVCQNPPAFRGQNWRDLTSNAFICDAQIILPTNNTRVVALGTNVTLDCRVNAHSAPDMKWQRGSRIIPRDNMFISSNMKQHDLSYTFTVQEEDLGEYRCIVNNTREELESSVTLTMDVTASKPVSMNSELVPTTTESTSREIVPRIRTTEHVDSIRELVSTITISEPGIRIKESSARINELTRTSGPNAMTTVEVTINVVLELAKNLEWLTNVRVTPVRVAT